MTNYLKLSHRLVKNTELEFMEKQELSALEDSKEAAELGHFLGIEPIPAAVMAACISLQLNEERVGAHRICETLCIEPYEHMDVLDLLRMLCSMGLLVHKHKRRENEFFHVPVRVLRGFRTGKFDEKEKLDNVGVIETLIDMLDRLWDNEMGRDAFQFEFEQLTEENKDFPLFPEAKKMKLSLQETMLMAYVMSYMIQKGDSASLKSGLRMLFSGAREQYTILSDIRNNRGNIMKNGLLEFNGDAFQSMDEVYIPKDILKKYVGDLAVVAFEDVEEAIVPSEVRAWDTIAPRQLFYNNEEKLAVEKLQSILKASSFRAFEKRMRQRKMRFGMCVLLYGAPGTGKTETVLQLARKTKRDVFVVDVSNIRSKWMGESEKNMKAMFLRYNTWAKSCTRKPILFLNEADSLIGRRVNVSTSTDQVSNSLQNILLEELENLEGILVATTNLLSNMDSAFERRFLFKVKMSLPDKEVRCKIWKSMLKGLATGVAEELSVLYDFSGGQIENIVRKAEIEYLLSGKKPGLSQLIDLCTQEVITNEKTSSLGFRIYKEVC